MVENREQDTSVSLLECFNKREASAFATVYTRFFVELHAYALRLYRNTAIAPEDAVQDAFAYLWESRQVTFDHLFKIKAFLLVVIKNRYFHALEHLGVVDRYRSVAEHETDFENDVLYGEQLAALMESVERIADPGRKVIKYYMAGYEAEDIAKEMQINVQSVYNIKSQTIRLLKKYFTNKNKGV